IRGTHFRVSGKGTEVPTRTVRPCFNNPESRCYPMKEEQAGQISPKATDRQIKELMAGAAEYGLVITGRCKHCLRPISSARSIRDRVGPVCRSRHGEES